MTKKRKVKYAESRSRTYTVNELKNLGWDVRHPKTGGNVLEENEAKSFDSRLDELLGLNRPDFLIYYNNSPCIVIENKDDRAKFEVALSEAKWYSNELSKKYFDLKIVTVVAGNEENGVIVRNYYRNDEGNFDEITGNGYPLTNLLSREEVEQVLLNKSATIDLKVPSSEEFYKIAEKVNQIFHDANVNKSDRAIYLGAILLGMKQGSIDVNPNVIIQQINANVGSALDSVNKGDLKKIIKVHGSSPKLKEKLPLIFHELDRLNIRALMNSGADVLGSFFETFLRYGNDAKELGIVFTPRHIVDLMVDLIDIRPNDVIFDPACGTGGFLIGSFNKMKEQIGNDNETLRHIGLHQLIGCDSDVSGKIPALAVINMIFRGDGKSNIYNENCFNFGKFSGKFATKVLMNPPFAQSDEPEEMFVEKGLESLKNGNLLAAIIPYSLTSSKSLARWRENVLKDHTLVGVITLPADLFYPTSSSVSIIILTAHFPHSGKIWFCIIENDGLMIKRKKRVECPGEQLSKAKKMFRNREEEPGFACYKELVEDELYEFSPEAYLDPVSIQEEAVQGVMNQMVRDFFAFNIKYSSQIGKTINTTGLHQGRNIFSIKEIDDIFDINYGQHEINSKKHLDPGETPVISSQGVDNGCYGFFDIEPKFTKPVISVPRTGSIGLAFVQEFPCCIDDNCLVLTPKDYTNISLEEMYFVASIIRMESWRYRYGRQITPPRLRSLIIDFTKFNADTLVRQRNFMDDVMSNWRSEF